MSSTKRGDPLPAHHNGPYYSRYTKHKVIFNFNTPNEQISTSPDPYATIHNNSSDPKLVLNRRHSVADSLISPNYSTETPFRKISQDGQLSPRSNTQEFKAVSPKFNLYDSPLSTFRCGSLESNRSVSPNRQVSFDQSATKNRRSAFVENNAFVNNLKSKGKFASILSKHTFNIFAAATLKLAHEKVRKEKLTHSCPDLISPTESRIIIESNKGLPEKTSSYNELSTLSADIDKQPNLTGNNLKVPDIFTTSFTHSKSSSTSSSPSTTARYTLSLQDIPDASRKSSKKFLRRTISLTKAEPEFLKIGHLLPPTMYRDDQIAQITDYLFIGSIESAFNERRMCRLEVESIVDISNINDMQVPSNKKTQCPCLCQMEFKHFRSRLIIAVADEENEGIDEYFEEVNRFIEGARRCSKKVLIYSYEGKSRAAVFAIQYLMAYEGLLLRQAYNMVKKQRPQVSLNPAYQRLLEKLEKAIFPDEKHSVNMCNEYLNVADPQAIKCAWVDC